MQDERKTILSITLKFIYWNDNLHNVTKQIVNNIALMESNRRDFLKKGIIATLASVIPFKVNADSRSDCEPTTTDILGPFFWGN